MKLSEPMLLQAVLAWPALGGLAWLVAPLLPQEAIWAQALAAVGWSALPWVAVGWPVWTLLWAGLGRRLAPWMGISLLLLPAVGRPLSRAPAAQDARPNDLRVGVFNINAYSPAADSSALRERVTATGVDVAVVLEKRPDSDELDGLVRIADDFEMRWPRPSHHSSVHVRESLGVSARVTEQIGSESMAMPVAVVELAPVHTCLLGVHAPPQVPKNASGMRPYIDWLSEHIEGGRLSRALPPCELGQPVIVAGDLNHVPDSWPLQRLHGRGLADAVGPAGLFALTWPSGGGWLDLPLMRLDHVLHGPVGMRGLQKVRVPDSDHQGWVFSVGPE